MASTQTDRIDAVNSSVALKAPCRAVATAPITLYGLQTIDGVSLAAADRVLVTAQADATKNGIYTAQTTAWVRDADFDGPRDVVNGTLCWISDGTLYGSTYWRVTATNPVLIGSSSITFTPIAFRNEVTSTSGSSLTVGTGGFTGTVVAGAEFQVGQYVTWVNGTNYIYGNITAYAQSTGVMAFTGTVSGGSGTFSSWNVSLSAPPGIGDAATASAAAALASQNAAEVSETNAANSATGASGYSGQAGTYASNASASASAASSSASAASGSASAASSSQSSASASASSASGSAGTATTQAGIATTQAGIATTQAGNAASSASSASGYASAASGSAGTATTQAGIATTQAGNAATGAGTATTQAGIATTQAGNASTSAGTATTQAGIATTQAGIATTQAGIATTQASDAAASAVLASTYAAALTDTSTTSLTIGTGAQTLTVSAGKQFVTGEFLTISHAVNQYMQGQVTSYSGTTLVVNVLNTGGSGTFTSWVISPAGAQGATGPTGASGSIPVGAAGGTVDAITVTIAGASTADTQTIEVVSAGANTSTTPTLKLGVDAAHTITARGGQALVAGDIGPAGWVGIYEYNGANTRWELVNPTKTRAADVVGSLTSAQTGSISTSQLVGTLTTAQVGQLSAGNLPNPSSSTLGGIKSIAAVAGQFLSSIGTDGTPVLSSGGGSITWTAITTGQTAVSNNGYICNSASILTVTLPTSPAVGAVVEVAGNGPGGYVGGFAVAPGSGCTINYGSTQVTSTGAFIGDAYTTARLVATSSTSWIVTQVPNALTAGTAPGSLTVDPFWSNVTLLLPLNNNVTDSSGNALTVTNTSVGFSSSVTKYTPYSGSFNGTSSTLDASSPGTSQKFSGDFSIEVWVYASARNNNCFISTGAAGSGTALSVRLSGSGYLTYGKISIADYITDSVLFPLSTWTHVALTRQGSLISLWKGGVLVGSYTETTNFSDGAVTIGHLNGSTYWFSGYLAHYRVTNGVCRYSSNFTVPGTAFNALADTAADPVWNDTTCLLHLDNNLTDSSGNAVGFTAYGSPAFSSGTKKFGTHSLQLNGSTQYIKATSGLNGASLFSGDFTIEGWFNCTTLPTGGNYQALFDIRDGSAANGFVCYLRENGGQYFNFGGTGVSDVANSSMTAGNWAHVAAVKSGANFLFFVNGVLLTSAAYSGTLPITGNQLIFGGNYNGGAQWFNGYIDELRISKFARYTSNFTAPTAAFLTALPTGYDPFWQDVTFMPRAAAGNTGTDVSGNALALTLTSVTTSNSSPQQDAYEWVLNGSTSIISAPIALGTGDFTVEAYVKATTFAGSTCIPFGWDPSGTVGFAVQFNASGVANIIGNAYATLIAGTTTCSTGNWIHVAVVRQGSTAMHFVNGVLQNSVVSGVMLNNLTAGTCYVGSFSGSSQLNGQVSAMRVTKAARYTANFTAPTSPFLTVGAT